MLFIATKPGDVVGRVAVATTAGQGRFLKRLHAVGVINYEVRGSAAMNPYRIEPIIHHRAA